MSTEAGTGTGGKNRQYHMPNVPTREEVFKNEWEQIELLRTEARSKLATATRGAESGLAQTQDCAAVLAKVAAAMLDGARKMEKILTAEDM